jgi:hypothetical protein
MTQVLNVVLLIALAWSIFDLYRAVAQGRTTTPAESGIGMSPEGTTAVSFYTLECQGTDVAQVFARHNREFEPAS